MFSKCTRFLLETGREVLIARAYLGKDLYRSSSKIGRQKCETNNMTTDRMTTAAIWAGQANLSKATAVVATSMNAKSSFTAHGFGQ